MMLVRLGAVLLGFLLLVGCQPAMISADVDLLPTATVTRAQPLVAAITIRPTMTPSPFPVVIIDLSPSDTPPAAIVLPAANELETATALPTPTETAPPTETPVPTETATPIPTFTPPALPGTSANEHYWLRRPVPDDGVVWTNKVYPYASTRGGALRPHHGVEFDVQNGSPVLAAAAGTVVTAGDDSSSLFGPETNFYGNLVVIEHQSKYNGMPLYTLYGHLSQVGVAVGQQVEALQPIGLVGSTGVADGPHLHFEVRVGCNQYGCTRNPSLWLYPFKDYGTIAGRIVRPNGTPIEGFQVTATRVDAASTYKGTTTYSGNTVNADDGWNENFVIDDVNAGYYQINFKVNGVRYKEQFWVYPYLTTFVEIVVDAP
jgi:murein DD-endopeptidase MepM/ murein hydrolase activator NlpD